MNSIIIFLLGGLSGFVGVILIAAIIDNLKGGDK
jgi:hypothetical protein